MVADAAGTPATPPPDWPLLLGVQAWDDALDAMSVACQHGDDYEGFLDNAFNSLLAAGVLHIEYRTRTCNKIQPATLGPDDYGNGFTYQIREQRLVSAWTEVPRD